MAITIGKTATVVLNRFCNLVLKPEPVATGGGGGGDATPNPTPDWTNVNYLDVVAEYQYQQQQINGINVTITLKLNYDNFTNKLQLYYKTSNTTISYNQYQNPTDLGFTAINDNGTLTVSNTQYLAFGVNFTPNWLGGELVGTATVTNVTDSNTVLDTFTVAIYQ